MLQNRWLQQATSLPRIEIRQRVFKKKGEKGKESGGVEATSKKTDPEGNQLSIQRNSNLLQNDKVVLLL